MNKYKYITDLVSKRLDTISKYNPVSYSVLLDAERYSLLAGGKHLRSLILIKTAMLGGCKIEDVIDFACSIEMVHTYSLIHDDMPEMDNDELRRGKPTCHKKYGADIALLAGDALVTKAFNILAADTHFDDTKKVRCIKILSDLCGEHGMLAGQTIDKISENKRISYSELTQLHARKTGDMFLAAIRMGCVLGDINTILQNKLEKYIDNLGIAFQIQDDILDTTSTSDLLGKPVNSDIESNKSTFVSMLGIDKSKKLLDDKINSAIIIAKSLDDEFFIKLAEYFGKRNN